MTPERGPIEMRAEGELSRLVLNAVECREELGQLGWFSLAATARGALLRSERCLGQLVVLELSCRAGVREASGMVSELRVLEVDGELVRYAVELRPWLWFAGLSAECRVFVSRSVVEVLEEVLSGQVGCVLENRLVESHPVREVIIQYRESDSSFALRLMQREGIYFFFRYETGKQILVLCDSPAAHEEALASPLPFRPPDRQRQQHEEYIESWQSRHRVMSTCHVLGSFDFRRPAHPILAMASRPAVEAVGQARSFDYDGQFVSEELGDLLAGWSLQRAQSESQRYSGSTNCRTLAVGDNFGVQGFPGTDGQRYLVVAATTVITARSGGSAPGAEGEAFRVELVAQPAELAFRPARSVPLPRIRGVQTATVVGPPGSEVHTDPLGRVKLRFHWDLRSQGDPERSSPWVRVAQWAAGEHLGAVSTPRVGHEVVVEFEEGDPERPVVVGHLYNGKNPPPWAADESPTKTGLRTRSSPGGTRSNFSELSFEDRLGYELVSLRSERDLGVAAKRDRVAQLGGNDRLVVAGERTTEVAAREDKIVREGGAALFVAREYEVDAERVAVRGRREVRLEAGGSTLVLDAEGLSVQARGGARLRLGAELLAAAAGEASLRLADSARMAGKGQATLELSANAELCSGSGAARLDLGVAGAALRGAERLDLLSEEEIFLCSQGQSCQASLGRRGFVAEARRLDLAGGGQATISAALIRIG